MTNISEKKILQNKLAKFLVDDVFNTITDDDILTVIPTERGAPESWRYQNKTLTPGQILALKNQSTQFYNSDLWKLLKSELIYLAQKNGMERAQTADDLIASKMLQYLVDTVDSRLKTMIK